MSAGTIYLITGVNRGIGRALVETLLLVPNTTVIGTVRNTSSKEANDLQTASIADGSKLHLIAMEMSDTNTIFSAIKSLQVDHIDVVISNAAISRIQRSVAEVPLEEVLDHFKVNSIGSLALYQATRHLLFRSTTPKFVFISSPAGSIGIQASFPFNGTPYNVSKAAVNTIATRLAFEEKDKLIVVLLHPGAVETDMLTGPNLLGIDTRKVVDDAGFPVITTRQSVDFVLKTIHASTHKDSGKFIDATTGQELPW